MEFNRAEYFSHKHGGFDGLMKFIELCNTEKDLKKISIQFNISPSQVCRLRAGLLEQTWRPKRGVIEYVKFQKSNHEREIKRRQEFMDSDTKKAADLQLLMGKDMKWIK
jgi:hypothetical protein